MAGRGVHWQCACAGVRKRTPEAAFAQWAERAWITDSTGSFAVNRPPAIHGVEGGMCFAMV